MQNTKPQTLINGPLYQINALLQINEMCTMIAPMAMHGVKEMGQKDYLDFTKCYNLQH